MHMSRRLVVSLAGLAAFALAGCAMGDVDERAEALSPRAAEKLEDQLAGKVAGETVSCIPLRDADQPIRVSDSILLYRVSGGLVYRNDLRPACNGLGRDDDILVVRPFGSRLCDGDIIRMVDRGSGFPSGGCAVGKFTPYRTPG